MGKKVPTSDILIFTSEGLSDLYVMRYIFYSKSPFPIVMHRNMLLEGKKIGQCRPYHTIYNLLVVISFYLLLK